MNLLPVEFDGESWVIIGRERMGRADDPRDIGIRGYHLNSDGNLWMADNAAGVYRFDGGAFERVFLRRAHDPSAPSPRTGPIPYACGRPREGALGIYTRQV